MRGLVVAAPSATAVTRPEDETLATDDAEDAQATGAPPIVTWFWSLTIAVTC